jgi:hypothetical protein
MFDLIGYLSSFFATFGLAAGFLIGGLIFLILLVYGFSIYLRASREGFREEHHPALAPSPARLVAAHHRKENSTRRKQDQKRP